jgi:hypothetical protein
MLSPGYDDTNIFLIDRLFPLLCRLIQYNFGKLIVDASRILVDGCSG